MAVLDWLARTALACLRYKEQITNGLDLVSFLLITPETLKFLRRRAIVLPITYSILTGILALGLGVIFVNITLQLLSDPAQVMRTGFHTSSLLYAWIALIMLWANFGLLVYLTVMLRLIARDKEFVEAVLPRHASFQLGVALFLLSRVLAFVAAFFPVSDHSG